MWFESSAVATQYDFDKMLRTELLKTFKNITDNNIKESLEIIKVDFNILKKLKEYIDISIDRHPTWGVDQTVDEFIPPGILSKSGFIDHSDQHLSTSVKLQIPDYYIGNWSKEKVNTTNRRRPVSSGRGYNETIGNRIVSYKKSLERLANTLNKVGIEWNDKTNVLVNSVINFLNKYYKVPTKDQLDIAVKIVRMSLLPTRSPIPYRQIFTDTFHKNVQKNSEPLPPKPV